MSLRSSRFLFAIAAAALFFGSATPSLAVPITVPTGLNPGDQYRLAFVTSTTRDATSAIIADYNAFVTGVANTVPELAALGTTWTAIASTSAVAARDNTATNPDVNGIGVRIYLLNDTKLTDSNPDLWSGDMLVFFDMNEFGVTVGGDNAWTGSWLDGTPVSGVELGASHAVYGRTDAPHSPVWVIAGGDPASAVNRLYALSGPLVYVPEPGTASLLALGLIALVGKRRRAN